MIDQLQQVREKVQKLLREIDDVSTYNKARESAYFDVLELIDEIIINGKGSR